MYKFLHKLALSVLIAGIFPIIVPAQKLGSLPRDPAVTEGTLPNGVRYCLVKDATETGRADFALILKGTRFKEDPLKDLPHFKDARRFLAGHGVDPRPDGYARQLADAAILRFEKMPLSGAACLDSTLLLLTDLSGRYDGTDQMLVCSGDIDPAATLQKIKLLSLFVPKRAPGPKRAPYHFRKTDQIACERGPARRQGGVSFSVTYRAPRTPEEQIGTVQTTVSFMFSSQLGMLLKNRLRAVLRQEDIPATGIDYRYVPSTRTLGDETLTLSLVTDEEHLEAAASAVGAVLADIDIHGAVLAEYRESRTELLMRATRINSFSLFHRGGQLDRCIDAFLYGAPLTSTAAVKNFYFSRNLPEATELKLFNDFAQAVISPGERLTLRSSSATARGDVLIERFLAGWHSREDKGKISFAVNQADTAGFVRADGKTRLRSERKDPVSGGLLWTFSEGQQVVYKKLPSNGVLYYALLIRGGFATIDGLLPGEGAYVGELLDCYDIGGFKGADFKQMLRTNGISMRTELSPSDLRLSGAAPASRLALLLKSLCALFHERRPDAADLEYHRKVCALESGYRSREAVLDSLCVPDPRMSAFKRLGHLPEGLEQKADAYFSDQFSRLNDGIFVLVGDADPAEVKRQLLQYLGAFPVRHPLPPRQMFQTSLPSGASTYMEEGSPQRLDIRLSAPLALSGENFLTAAVVRELMHDRLVDALQGCGMSVDLWWDFKAWPKEVLSYTLSITPTKTSGKPWGDQGEDILTILARVREVLGALSGEAVKEADMKTYRDRLAADIKRKKDTPATCIQNVLARYADGKDLLSRYQERMKLVDAARVRSVMHTVCAGSNTESIVH